MFDFGSDVKNGEMDLGGWSLDSPRHFDDQDSNEGFYKRLKNFADIKVRETLTEIPDTDPQAYEKHEEITKKYRSATGGDQGVPASYYYIVPLFSEFFVESNPIPPANSIQIELVHNVPQFYLNVGGKMTEADATARGYHIQVTSCKIRMRTRQLVAEKMYEIQNILAKNRPDKILYRTNRLTTTRLFVSPGQVNFLDDTLPAVKVMPSRIYVMVLEAIRYQGRYKLNPYNFRTGFDFKANATDVVPYQNDITNMTITVAGQTFGCTSHDTNLCRMTELYEIYQSHGRSYQTESRFVLTREQFMNGSYIVCFDMTLDARSWDGSTLHSCRQGQIKLEIGFKLPLQQGLQVLMVNQYASGFTLDKMHKAADIEYR